MSVLIGMASIDERGRANGGAAGDQSGREVYSLPWYNGGWNVLLRPRDPAVADKLAAFLKAACENDRIGYDQWQRNTLRDAARAAGWDAAKITAACECDCSSLMAVCAEAAGVDMAGAYTAGNAPTTWTMRRAFFSTGAFEVLQDRKYLDSGQYLRAGDILVRESGHTVGVISGGDDAVKSYELRVKSSADAEAEVYTVVAGDTLWGIARRYGATVAVLCAANGLDPAGFIFPGQKLKIVKS